jgi:lipoprotein-releasing system ATP-binding protein
MLKANNIHKKFGDIDVLKGINLHVQTGEIVSIVGASGAGKSTLLHILGSLDRPDQGEIMIKEQKVFDLNKKQLANFRNRHIGFVFQFHNLLPEFTALENVCIPAYIQGIGKEEATAKAEKLLDMLGLSHRLTHKPAQLSGGEQQRTAVARALVNNPGIVFADEPSGNLDSHSAEELHKLFFDLRDKLNKTFVIVTHNQELADLADRKLIIQDGVII